jgi:hypothetical protein
VIEVKLKDGKVFKGKTADLHRGGPKAPFSREELLGKFNDATQLVLSSEKAQQLFETFESLETIESIRKIIEMLSVY